MSTSAAPLATSTPTPQPTVEPELQSALTKKFSDAEWSAVKEFRTVLPLIFEEAFKELKPGKALDPVDIWGVKVDPSRGGVDDPRISVILLKFLKAR